VVVRRGLSAPDNHGKGDDDVKISKKGENSAIGSLPSIIERKAGRRMFAAAAARQLSIKQA